MLGDASPLYVEKEGCITTIITDEASADVKATGILALAFPDKIFLKCSAHEFNLIAHDLFSSLGPL